MFEKKKKKKKQKKKKTQKYQYLKIYIILGLKSIQICLYLNTPKTTQNINTYFQHKTNACMASYFLGLISNIQSLKNKIIFSDRKNKQDILRQYKIITIQQKIQYNQQKYILQQLPMLQTTLQLILIYQQNQIVIFFSLQLCTFFDIKRNQYINFETAFLQKIIITINIHFRIVLTMTLNISLCIYQKFLSINIAVRIFISFFFTGKLSTNITLNQSPFQNYYFLNQYRAVANWELLVGPQFLRQLFSNLFNYLYFTTNFILLHFLKQLQQSKQISLQFNLSKIYGIQRGKLF
eukprot:TRINITY_DN15132_c1_g1_i1.p1 TRINITY_DN15132_c1_g1~~TRINITY_DN15132_c1_g1_i1.p1  ORF type:complete len:344 (-),score=0.32 TRINITY_DN15132_c1_g1_i1:124-1002(-)